MSQQTPAQAEWEALHESVAAEVAGIVTAHMHDIGVAAKQLGATPNAQCILSVLRGCVLGVQASLQGVGGQQADPIRKALNAVLSDIDAPLDPGVVAAIRVVANDYRQQQMQAQAMRQSQQAQHH